MYEESADLKAFMRRWFEEVWNKGREEAIDELFAEDGIAHGLANVAGAQLRGRGGLQAVLPQFSQTRSRTSKS